MQLELTRFTVHKRVPLRISRGVSASSENVWVKLIHDGIEGWGETTPVGFTKPPQPIELLESALADIGSQLESISPFQGQLFEEAIEELPSAARSALDTARYDWLGKRVGLPLWKMWGLERSRIAKTTVTVGIMTPEEARVRVQQWRQQVDAQTWKVKLGNPEGIEADKAMLKAVREEIGATDMLMVDANGGWNLQDAIEMCKWLATQNVLYVEQPLAIGHEEDLKALHAHTPLPLFADESCLTSSDLPGLIDRVDGINIKLLKCGGLSEAMRMIHIARTFGLKVMFGCFSETSLANSAAAQLSPLADYLDLDSHLNLKDDPFVGAQLREGKLWPSDAPGLGVRLAPT